MIKLPSLSKVLEFIFGPWMILPQSFIVAIIFGGFIYEWPESTMNYEKYIFFQGSIDMGGACIFAGVILVYIFFGFTASWYLTMKLNQITYQSYLHTVLHSLSVLKYHFVFFIIGSLVNIPDDAYAGSNDFRNMFLFVFFIYLLSILFICFLKKYKIKFSTKIILAPTLVIVWLFIGSDGNTERAGQFVSSDKNYVYKIRGKRHSIMVSWHKLCDSQLGEIE
jgi:hypothetical protein